jgi:pSer/pThr/pTyr-binding forkhead associated (FHA) protein
MAITLVVRSKDDESPLAVKLDVAVVVVGRGAGCDMVLEDPSVSVRHATLRRQGDSYVLFDEGSSNGTFTDGAKLGRGVGHVLRHGDQIRLGQVSVEVLLDENPVEALHGLASRDLALAMADRLILAEKLGRISQIMVVGGPDKSRAYPLAEEDRVYIVGRDPLADFPLRDRGASRKHLAVVRRGTKVHVRDLGSQNGTELGGRRLSPNVETPWHKGVRVKLGSTVLSHEVPGAGSAMQSPELVTSSDPADSDEEPASRPEASQDAGPDPLAGPLGKSGIQRSPSAVATGKSEPRKGRGELTLVEQVMISVAVIGCAVTFVAIVILLMT